MRHAPPSGSIHRPPSAHPGTQQCTTRPPTCGFADPETMTSELSAVQHAKPPPPADTVQACTFTEHGPDTQNKTVVKRGGTNNLISCPEEEMRDMSVQLLPMKKAQEARSTPLHSITQDDQSGLASPNPSHSNRREQHQQPTTPFPFQNHYQERGGSFSTPDTASLPHPPLSCEHCCLGCQPRLKCPVITSRNFVKLLKADPFTCMHHRKIVRHLLMTHSTNRVGGSRAASTAPDILASPSSPEGGRESKGARQTDCRENERTEKDVNCKMMERNQKECEGDRERVKSELNTDKAKAIMRKEQKEKWLKDNEDSILMPPPSTLPKGRRARQNSSTTSVAQSVSSIHTLTVGMTTSSQGAKLSKCKTSNVPLGEVPPEPLTNQSSYSTSCLAPLSHPPTPKTPLLNKKSKVSVLTPSSTLLPTQSTSSPWRRSCGRPLSYSQLILSCRPRASKCTGYGQSEIYDVHCSLSPSISADHLSCDDSEQPVSQCDQELSASQDQRELPDRQYTCTTVPPVTGASSTTTCSQSHDIVTSQRHSQQTSMYALSHKQPHVHQKKSKMADMCLVSVRQPLREIGNTTNATAKSDPHTEYDYVTPVKSKRESVPTVKYKVQVYKAWCSLSLTIPGNIITIY